MSSRKRLYILVIAVIVLGAGGYLASRSYSAASTTVSVLAKESHFHGIAVDPADSTRIYLATHHGFYTVTPDGSASLVSANRDDFMGFAPHPTDPSLLYASGHPAGGGNIGFIASTDRGKTWRRIGEGAYSLADFHQMTVSLVDPATIYGIYGTDLQVSHDGGRTWKVVAPIPDRIFDLATSVEDADGLYAASRGGLLYSGDGGRSWTSILQDPVTVVETTSKGHVLTFVIGSGLMLANEADFNWRTLSSNFGEDYVVHLAVDPTDESNLFAITLQPQTRAQAILTSRDGGVTWTTIGGNDK